MLCEVPFDIRASIFDSESVAAFAHEAGAVASSRMGAEGGDSSGMTVRGSKLRWVLVYAVYELSDFRGHFSGYIEVVARVKGPTGYSRLSWTSSQVDCNDPVALIQKRTARGIASRIAVMNQHVRRTRVRRRTQPFAEPAFLDHLLHTGVLVSVEPDVSHFAETETVLVRRQRLQGQRLHASNGLCKCQQRKVVFVRQNNPVTSGKWSNARHPVSFSLVTKAIPNQEENSLDRYLQFANRACISVVINVVKSRQDSELIIHQSPSSTVDT